jgi:alpha(1,3/1,4) fucosyltransferase
MKPRVRLAFSDFHSGFNPRDNYFVHLLGQKHDVELSDQPDVLIYSCYGSREEFRRYRCLRIFYTSENQRPNFADCDYAFTFDYNDHPRHYRLPLYPLYFDVQQLVKRPQNPRQILAEKTRFCNFVYSNRYCRFRNAFFHQLSKYKHVDSGGRLFNNMGGNVKDKLAFIRPYKFTIAFENSSYPGYTTEKIAEPMLVNSLPIYWGNPLVHRDFNPVSFINYFDYGSPEALIERIIEVDRNDELYCQYLSQPWYHDNRPNAFVDSNNVLAQFELILSISHKPIGQQAPESQFFLARHGRTTKLRIKKNWRRLNRWAKYQWQELNTAGAQPTP